MTDKVKTAFDSIHAESALKEKTLEFLRKEVYNKRTTQVSMPTRRLAAGFAFLLCLAFTSVISANIYYTETAYIDFDVNPSVEFALNRFDRVIGVYAYNSDADSILEGLSIKHKTYKDAVNSMLGAFAQNGYLRDDGLVSVTLQTNDSVRESEMLSGLTQYVKAGVSGHHGSVQIDVFPVSEPVRNDAHALDLSPAKYLAILELQEVDPAATIESCRGHTIGELKNLTKSHGAGHHAQSSGGDIGENVETSDPAEESENSETNNQDDYPPGTHSHHGENTGHGGRHG